MNDEKQLQTFEEWIAGFEDRYSPEKLELFKACWEHTVNTKKLVEKFDIESNKWDVDWISYVAWELGK